MMTRGNEENNHKSSSILPPQSLHCRVKPGDISIPLDLTVEILKKLPTKSILRFQCVSKQWSSIIGSCRHFIDSIVTRSLTHPPSRDTQIIYHHHQAYPKQDFFIFSSTYPKNRDNESISTTANAYEHVRGLICCWSNCPNSLAIYNPTTRQYFSLPNTDMYIGTCYFGYDPLNNQYKVLCIPKSNMEEEPCQVFTLGDQKWRNIQGIGTHISIFYSVCINGVIYYRATKEDEDSNYFLVSFDVSSDKLARVEAPKTLIDHKCTLMNYKGKLGFICCQKGVEIWVMEDSSGKKQEWSKIIFNDMEGYKDWNVAGANHGGEIVFASRLVPCDYIFAVFYYEPNLNSLRYVEFEDLEDVVRKLKCPLRIWAVPDYVENTMRL